MTEYDPMGPAVKQDPVGVFGRTRSVCPVHHHVLPQEVADRISSNPLVARQTNEFWSLLSFEACRSALLDPGTFSSKDGPGPEWMAPMTEEGVLLFADDPAHGRQRRLAARAFTPRAVERIRDRIWTRANALIDNIAAAGRAELMEAFAIPLTVRTIADIFGVEEHMVEHFRRWGNAIVAAFGGDPAAAESGFVAMQELFEYLTGIIQRIRSGDELGEQISEGVLAGMVRAEEHGIRLTDQELLLSSMQIITAGFETTSTAILNGVQLLCSHPAERAKLEADPSLLTDAVEEIVRYASPLEGLFRTTTKDVTIEGVTIPAESKVRIVYASANHDPHRFPEADVFRVDRDPDETRSHLAFGQGPHFCLGAALARAELACAFEVLLLRLPGLELDPNDPPVRTAVFNINGFGRLPVRWSTEGLRPGTESRTADGRPTPVTASQ